MPQNANGSATSASTTCIRRLLLWTQSNGDMTRVSESLAERTGLEPATPGVTGRYSNQLNYRSVVLPPGQLNGAMRPFELADVNRRQDGGEGAPSLLVRPALRLGGC